MIAVAALAAAADGHDVVVLASPYSDGSVPCRPILRTAAGSLAWRSRRPIADEAFADAWPRLAARSAYASRRFDSLLADAARSVVGGTSLYRLISTPNAIGLFAYLAATGILTRPFAGRNRARRFGLPRDRQCVRLDQAFAAWRCR